MLETCISMGSDGTEMQRDDRFYCSTAGVAFSDKQSLHEHYRSEWHRYNLKRKVAGLPPVSKEWFEARRAQLQRSSEQRPLQRTWLDPLTCKKFGSENTYLSFVNSKKYKAMVKRSGKVAPQAIVVERSEDEPEASTLPKIGPTYHTVAPGQGRALQRGQLETHRREDDESREESESEWETDSEGDEMDGEEDDKWIDWDVCQSLFDNHVSATFEENLEYMLKNFGFYIPDTEYLVNPEGLVKYLGAKIAVGKVPLYVRGKESHLHKTFRSLHAVQRHMIDTGRCRMVYEENEEEYEEFYNYSAQEKDNEDTTMAVSVEVSAFPATGELAIPSHSNEGSQRLVGLREYARYYKQKPKPVEKRQSVLVNSIVARYRALTVPTRRAPLDSTQEVQRQKFDRAVDSRRQMKMDERSAVIKNLPKSVPY